MNAVEKLAYLSCLPTVKGADTGRTIVDYAVFCAVSSIFLRDLIAFPEARHGQFTKAELQKAVYAETRPFDDYCNDSVESDFVDASINALIGSGFLNEDSNGTISCSYISRMVIDLWREQQPILIDESENETTADDMEIPELF